MRFLAEAGLVTCAEPRRQQGGTFLEALSAPDLLLVIAAALPVIHGLDQLGRECVRGHASPIARCSCRGLREDRLDACAHGCSHLRRRIADVLERGQGGQRLSAFAISSRLRTHGTGFGADRDGWQFDREDRGAQRLARDVQ